MRNQPPIMATDKPWVTVEKGASQSLTTCCGSFGTRLLDPCVLSNLLEGKAQSGEEVGGMRAHTDGSCCSEFPTYLFHDTHVNTGILGEV
jgi:hypothetical protein